MLNMFAELKKRVMAEVRIITHTTTPVDGAAGTGAGDCGKGSLCCALDTGKWYVNNNTKASPAWGIITSA